MTALCFYIKCHKKYGELSIIPDDVANRLALLNASILTLSMLHNTETCRSGGAHLRGLARGRQSTKETSQRWRGGFRDAVSDLTGLRIEPQTSRTNIHYSNRLVRTVIVVYIDQQPA